MASLIENLQRTKIERIYIEEKGDRLLVTPIFTLSSIKNGNPWFINQITTNKITVKAAFVVDNLLSSTFEHTLSSFLRYKKNRPVYFRYSEDNKAPASIEFNLPKSTERIEQLKMTLSFHDASGRLVTTLEEDIISAGKSSSSLIKNYSALEKLSAFLKYQHRDGTTVKKARKFKEHEAHNEGFAYRIVNTPHVSNLKNGNSIIFSIDFHNLLLESGPYSTLLKNRSFSKYYFSDAQSFTLEYLELLRIENCV